MKDVLHKWRKKALGLLDQAAQEPEPEKRSILEARAMVYIACAIDVQAQTYIDRNT